MTQNSKSISLTKGYSTVVDAIDARHGAELHYFGEFRFANRKETAS